MTLYMDASERQDLSVFGKQIRLQIYIRPIDADRSLLALMVSAGPRLISPGGLEAQRIIQVWRVTV